MILPKEKLAGLNPDFQAKLTRLSNRLPFTLTINEGVPADKDGSHVKDSEHFEGLGVDVSAKDGYSRYMIVQAALAEGIDRIGVYDKHIHLGVSTTLPRPVIWSGVSM